MNSSSSFVSNVKVILLIIFVFLFGFYSNKMNHIITTTIGNKRNYNNINNINENNLNTEQTTTATTSSPFTNSTTANTDNTDDDQRNYIHNNETKIEVDEEVSNSTSTRTTHNTSLPVSNNTNNATTNTTDNDNEDQSNHIHNNDTKMKEEDDTTITTHMICHTIANEFYQNLNPNTDIDNNIDNTIMPNPVSIWKYYTLQILHASIRYDIYREYVTKLLNYVTPIRLEQSLKTIPKNNDNQIDHIMHIIYNRYMYIKQQYDDNKKSTNNNTSNDNNTNNNNESYVITPRKLNIIVFGGSVTLGTNCLTVPIDIQNDNNETFPFPYTGMNQDECSWPIRLQSFINTLLLQTIIVHDNNNSNTDDPYNNNIDSNNAIVRVYKVTQGGTASDFGMNIIDMSLLPVYIPSYNEIDIVINAHSTNDAMQFNVFINKNNDGRTTIATEKVILEKVQGFIRMLLTTYESYDNYNDNNNNNNMNNNNMNDTSRNKNIKNSRRQPLLLFYNDAKGLRLNNVLNILSNYYGIGYMSYYDTLREIIYPNISETWFSFPPPSGGHFGMGMHITATWIITYNILHYITSYCTSHIYQQKLQKYFNNNNNPNHKWNHDDNDDDTTRSSRYTDFPKKRPLALPPYLDFQSRYEDISSLWDKAEQDRIQQLDIVQPNQHQTQCLFACLAGGIGRISNTQDLNNKMNYYITYNDGWESVDDFNKLGYVPVKGFNSNFIMSFINVSSSSSSSHSTMNIMYMKSYGTKWENSTVNMTVYVTKSTSMATESSNNNTTTTTTNATIATSELLLGYHNHETSVTYTNKVPITNGYNIGDTIQVQFQLISGETFKITGMALC